MTYLNAILVALSKSKRSARDVSIAAVGHESAIRSIKRGLDLRGSTIQALCNELGLEFYVGPPRPPQVPAEILTAIGLSEGATVTAALRKIRKRFEQGDMATELLSKAVQEIHANAQAERDDLKELKVRISQLESGKTTH